VSPHKYLKCGYPVCGSARGTAIGGAKQAGGGTDDRVTCAVAGRARSGKMFVLKRSRDAMRVVVVVWYGLQAQEQASRSRNLVREGRGRCEEKA
jgi:hypothetical protein